MVAGISGQGGLSLTTSNIFSNIMEIVTGMLAVQAKHIFGFKRIY